MGEGGAFFDTIIARLSEVVTAPSREIFARLASALKTALPRVVGTYGTSLSLPKPSLT
jgi:hypothetical protein